MQRGGDGGGQMTIVNRSVPLALRTLGYSEAEIDQIDANVPELKAMLSDDAKVTVAYSIRNIVTFEGEKVSQRERSSRSDSPTGRGLRTEEVAEAHGRGRRGLCAGHRPR